MKRIMVIFSLFACYVLACSPLLLRYYHVADQLLNHMPVHAIFDQVMALAVIAIFFSLMAAALRCYILAYVLAFVPLFVEAVLLCSTVIVFIFHKEIVAAAVFGKIRTLGSTMIHVTTAPVRIFSSLIHRLLHM